MHPTGEGWLYISTAGYQIRAGVDTREGSDREKAKSDRGNRAVRPSSDIYLDLAYTT